MVSFSLYGVVPSPVDNSVWGVAERFPGYLVRVDRGNNPPQSCMTEIYKVPEPGFDPRGVDIDTNGVVWTALAASSHLASFDRRKCKPITGPRKVDGSECPEGWTLYQTTGPKLKGTNVPADFHYYNWVDQHNVLGLGANKPIANGSNSDSLLVLDPQTRQWTTLRVPYPLGFYSRGLDGRIDNPNGGWKGRALYANYGTHFVWHIEGGKGTKGKVGEVPAAARSAGELSPEGGSQDPPLRSTFSMMMNAVLALLLLLQAATAARPGVVTGRLQTREGAPAAADAHLRPAGAAGEHPAVRRSELLRDDDPCEHGADRRAGALSPHQPRARPVLDRRQRVRLSDISSGNDERRPRHGRHRWRRRAC